MTSHTHFEITNLRNDDASAPRFWTAEVRIGFEEAVETLEVIHWITAKVRITADEDITVPKLREVIFLKAIKILRRANRAVEGQTAASLLSDYRQREAQHLAV